MASLRLTEIVQDLRKRGSVFVRTPLSKGINLVKQQKRRASDSIGSIITRNWEKPRGGGSTKVREREFRNRSIVQAISDEVSKQGFASVNIRNSPAFQDIRSLTWGLVDRR